MAKRTSKADLILQEAKKRVEGARIAVLAAEARVELTRATLEAHEYNLETLESQLAREPRKPVPKSQSVASAKSKSLLKKLEAQSAAITEGATGSATSAGASGD